MLIREIAAKLRLARGTVARHARLGHVRYTQAKDETGHTIHYITPEDGAAFIKAYRAGAFKTGPKPGAPRQKRLLPKGIETYGVSLHTFNGRDCARDLVEELVDATQYAQQWVLERQQLLARVAELEAEVAKYKSGEKV